jgi:hypothetical protein
MPPERSPIRGRLLRRAMLDRDRYLAAALAEIRDEDLAAELGTDLLAVRRLRVASPPRPDHWRQDVQQLALAIGTHQSALAARLQRVSVRP